MQKMLKFKQFTEWLDKSLNEVTNKDVVSRIVSLNPKELGFHSENNRVKNLANISIQDFANMVKLGLGLKDSDITINPPGRSGSSKFSSVQFDMDGKTKNLVLAGGAVASRGHGFENNLYSDLQTFQANRTVDDKSYNYPNIIKTIATEFGIDENTSFTVTKEASANKKREVSLTDHGVIIGNGNLNIGSTVTDITLDVEGQKKYISLKLGNTVQFSNTGLVEIYPKDEIESGKVANNMGVALLNMLGIDNETFCEVFNSYGKKKFKEKHELEKSVNPKGLEQFVQSAMGYGYYMLHISDNEKTFEFYEVTEADMKKDIKVTSKMDILYGGVTGGAKNVFVSFKTKTFEFEIDFRNRSGGVEPTVMGTKYQYLNWKGIAVG